ncbi:uncharacterized protein LOC134203535 [Armigeres subalbatus]|uniref:uncharacterized protein LOC134203535 n=1 Tax=Armigeres subalbatus TaxID=124917 RepID=UPI002ED29595
MDQPKLIPWKQYEKCYRFVKQKSEKNFEVACTLCPTSAANISCGYSSSANLRSHLMRKHAWNDEKFQTELNTGKRKRDNDTRTMPITQKVLHDAVDALIINEGLDFSIVDSIYFKRIAELGLADSMTVGCRQSLTKRMDDRFQEMLEKMKKQLLSVKYVATTADCWTKFRRSYLGMTLHWIDEDTTERKSAALALKRIKGRHTADVLAAAIFGIHVSFELLSKVRRCTTDSAANLMKAFRVYACEEDHMESRDEGPSSAVEELDIVDVDLLLTNEEGEEKDYRLPPHQRCASHILNLVASTDAQKVEAKKFNQARSCALEKLKTWWKLQSKSSVVADVIKDCIGVTLTVPVKTRWNSEYDSIAQICNIIDKSPEKLQAAINKAGLPKLDPQDICFLKEYVWVSQPVAYTLDILQRAKYMYMGFLLPAIYGLQRNLENRKLKDGKRLKYCLPLHENQIAALTTDRRFGIMMNETDLIVATCLLPQFKLDWDGVRQHEKREEIRCLILTEMEKIDVSRNNSDDQKASNVSRMSSNENELDEEADFFGIATQNCETTDEADESCLEEFNRFLRTPADMSIAACYGIINKKPFPRLKQLFLKYNTALPASASVERLFSLVGAVFRPGRANLSDTKLEQQSLLSANAELF